MGTSAETTGQKHMWGQRVMEAPEKDHRPGQVGLHPRTQNLEPSLPRRGLLF